MRLDDFMSYAEEMWGVEKTLLSQKGKEYTVSSPDKHENFKFIGHILGISPELVCLVYMMKHLLSIMNYVMIGTEVSGEPIQGRINDARNYLLLLGSLICENRKEQDYGSRKNTERQRESFDTSQNCNCS